MQDLRHAIRKLTGFILAAALLLGAATGCAVVPGWPAHTPALKGSEAVASLEKIKLGGVDQWVLIRGQDRNKPVILFLHGGPGMPAMFLAHRFQRELERDFVVVHWDRRGAGKSFDAASTADSLRVSTTLRDTIELTELLRQRFAQEKIYLVAHSWGTYLGMLAVRDHPDYYRAYIGMGQLAGTWPEVQAARMEFLKEEARTTKDADLSNRLAAGLRDVGEDEIFRHGGELHAAHSPWPIIKTGLVAPEYTFMDALHMKKGADRVLREMQPDVEPRPLEGEITELRVPVFFFLGRHDYNTPSQLAADYLERLHAPVKKVVWFEQSAHFPFFEEPARFHDELVAVDKSLTASATSRVSLR